MKNKDLIDKLQVYFLSQDPEIVARILANCLVDYHRIYTLDELPEEEACCLFKRIEKNALYLREFAQKETHEPLTMGPLK